MYPKKTMKLAKKLYKDKRGLFGIYICIPPLIKPATKKAIAEAKEEVRQQQPAYARPYIHMVTIEEIYLRFKKGEEAFKGSTWRLQKTQEEIAVIFYPHEDVWSLADAWHFCLAEARRRAKKHKSMFQFFYGSDFDAD